MSTYWEVANKASVVICGVLASLIDLSARVTHVASLAHVALGSAGGLASDNTRRDKTYCNIVGMRVATYELSGLHPHPFEVVTVTWLVTRLPSKLQF
jgi:hypothetical protein